MNFESLVERLKDNQNVIGLLLLGSAGQSTLNAHSDRDILIVVDECPLAVTYGTVFCDDILIDLVIVTRQAVEDLITAELGSISLSDSRAVYFNWVLSGVIVLDRCGCLERLRNTLERIESRPELTEGESVSRTNRALYNLAQTRRMSGSPDSVYQQAVDLRMLYQLSDLMVDYFNLRGLPWRGEKEAIRHWRCFDPDYIDLFMCCYWEKDRLQRVRLYAELVKSTIEPAGFQWDSDGANFVLADPKEMTRENLLRAQQFWQSLLSRKR